MQLSPASAHPFKIVYRASGFTNDGLITAAPILLLETAIPTAAVPPISLPAVLARARPCSMQRGTTPITSPTSGCSAASAKPISPATPPSAASAAPQGVAGIENLIEEIAAVTGRDALEIRQTNCYQTGGRDVTPYGQTVRNNTLPELFSTLRRDCHYDARREQIATFNEQSPTELRGLALSAVKFGISFTRRTMNQANALEVSASTDGSVMVSTGARRWARASTPASARSSPRNSASPTTTSSLAPTSTDKNNNTSPTAASAGTDLNGKAAVRAAQTSPPHRPKSPPAMLTKSGDTRSDWKTYSV